MRITIVGGGQAGLQLGIGLRQKNLDVSIVSNRTPDDIRNGKVTSSQGMFDDALQSERDLGINFWEPECPNMDGVWSIRCSPGRLRSGIELGIPARQTSAVGRSASQIPWLDEAFRKDWRRTGHSRGRDR